MNYIGKEDKGIKLFFNIFKNHFFTLIFLNLIFIVTCIPIITIGPACKSMSKVTMDMVRDKSFGVILSYFLEFKKDFLKTAALLVFMSPKQMIFLLVLVVAPMILAVVYFQIGISVFIIWHFSIASVVSSINGWSIIKKYVVAENQEMDK